jgi:hypothetical protein
MIYHQTGLTQNWQTITHRRNVLGEAGGRWDEDVNMQTNLSRNDPRVSVPEQLHRLRAGFILMVHDMGLDFQWMRRLLNGVCPVLKGLIFTSRILLVRPSFWHWSWMLAHLNIEGDNLVISEEVTCFWHHVNDWTTWWGHSWDEDPLEDEVTWLDETLWVGEVLGEDFGLLGGEGMLRVKVLALISAMEMKGSSAKGKESFKDIASLKDQERLGVQALLEAQALLKDTSSVKAKPLLKDKTLVKMTTDHPRSKGRSRTRQCFMPTDCCGGSLVGASIRAEAFLKLLGPPAAEPTRSQASETTASMPEREALVTA